MVSQFYLGHLLEAREHGDRVLALYEPKSAEHFMQIAGQDSRTVVGIFSSHWMWMLGYADQAVQLSEETHARARRLGHAFNLAFALTAGSYVFDYRCEPKRFLACINEGARLAREQSIPHILQVAVPSAEGIGRLRSGQLSDSITLLRRSAEFRTSVGYHLFAPYFKAGLAQALALQGDPEAGLRLIEECLEQIERPGWQERVWLAEILRLKGWILSRNDDLAGAEQAYQASLDWARHQQAKSWELRTSTSLAKLWQGQGKRKEAHDLLAPVYNWFTEGLDTKDLKEAKALLNELA